MQGLLKSDIFFVVTTFVVFFVGTALVVALVYIIRILKDMKILSDKARNEGEKILNDVASFREDAKIKGKSLFKIFDFLGFPKSKHSGKSGTEK